MSLPTVIQTLLEVRTVRVAHLVEFGFCTQVRRLWNGSYTLTTGGHDWFGLRKLGGIEGLDDEGVMQASQMKFTVTGVEPRLASFLADAVAEDRSEYIGRIVRVWHQFFDEDWQKLDNPVARAAGIIDGLQVTRSPIKDGGWQRTVTITAENIFYGRGLPPAGYFTNRDQQIRHPGDRGLEFIPEIQETVIKVPWIS